MLDLYGGSTIGTNHLKTKDMLIGINNQDNHVIVNSENIKIGIVCDGCSSGENCEFGSFLGSKIIATLLMFELNGIESLTVEKMNEILQKIQKKLLYHLEMMTEFVGYKPLFFTILGVVILKEKTFIFGCGDGVYGLREVGKDLAITVLDQNNKPTYVAYNILFETNHVISVKECVNTEDLECMFIGSDGIHDFIKKQGVCLPGKISHVMDIEDFISDCKYKQNRTIDAYLKRLNLDCTIDNVYHPGLLPDDTTIIIGRIANEGKMQKQDDNSQSQ